jgi:hypothetical protein
VDELNINDLSREELHQLMADIHGRMQADPTRRQWEFTDNEIAAIMIACAIAREMW